MTTRPLAADIHTKALSRVRTALEQAAGQPGIALYSLAHDNTVMDYYRDKLQSMDPSGLIQAIEAGGEQLAEVVEYLKLLRTHIRNAEQDRGNK